jgi:hypothetical protein
MTRKIERQMIAAIKGFRSWKSGNTQVLSAGGIFNVYLHGNHIAKYRPYAKSSLDITLAGWNTTTTRSRLTALCQEFVPFCRGVGTRKGQAELRYIVGNQPISSNEWVTV